MRSRALAPVLLLAGSMACQARIDGGSSADSPGNVPGTAGGFDTQSECKSLGEGIHPGPSPLRRLTRHEYDNTVADVVGDTSKPASDFPPEARALGFNNIADAQTVTTLLAEAYNSAAAGIAERAAANLTTLLGCPATDGSCVDRFIQQFGSRAYRRPLRADEAQRLRAIYDWGDQNTTAEDGVRMVMEVVLQSPDFLYRPEIGGAEAAPGVVKLTSYEMATRLSYLLRGSMPDPVLLDEAAADRLQTPEQIRAQAERLLQLPQARETFKSFHEQWLDLEHIEALERDAAIYPGYSGEIPALLREETQAFIDHVIFEDGGRLSTLLTAPYTFVEPKLAAFYGLAAPADQGFVKVPTDATRRIGLLTHGSLLALHAQPLQTSPVHRGKFIRESLLCQFLPPPPANQVIMPPDLDPNLTTRQRFSQHSEDAACAGCHALIDPVGLGFENFDAVGRWRDTENGLPIDASGNLLNTDVDGAFVGAAELATKLAQSEQVADCMMKTWARFAYGRSETLEDACSLEQTRETFEGSQRDIKQLVLALTQTDAFLYRKAVTP